MLQISLSPLRKRVLKALLEDAIMVKLMHEPLSGYDLLLQFNEQFGINLSPGTVYSTLLSMERDGVIISNLHSRKREYKLTEEGKIKLKEQLDDVDSLNMFIHSLLTNKD